MIRCKYIKKKHFFYGVKIFETFKRVFFALNFFRVAELSSSKSAEPILLKFYKLFLYIKYEVRLSSFFFILTYFKITKFPIF